MNKEYDFTPSGICCKSFKIILDDTNHIVSFQHKGGCSGNLSAVGKLISGKSPKEVSETLKGIQCGNKSTSCADQLAIFLESIS